ncbi:DUF7266 family protein [Halorarius litoreus]|uniref:DUF7266 family protein n=1 Tax=Halorarius litoreus TaxID=2962676 RepID=UPI0020CE31AD|nr:hypothetical protein [Halorarius litoreus]
MGDNRGVSAVLAYTLTLGITSLLVIGLLVATGGFASDQRHETVHDELEVLGQQLAADLSAADRLVRNGGQSVSVRRSLPNEATGIPYTIEVVGGTPTVIRLSTSDPNVVVEVQVRTQTPVSSSSVSSGDVIFVESSGNLVVRNV